MKILSGIIFLLSFGVTAQAIVQPSGDYMVRQAEMEVHFQNLVFKDVRSAVLTERMVDAVEMVEGFAGRFPLKTSETYYTLTIDNGEPIPYTVLSSKDDGCGSKLITLARSIVDEGHSEVISTIELTDNTYRVCKDVVLGIWVAKVEQYNVIDFLPGVMVLAGTPYRIVY